MADERATKRAEPFPGTSDGGLGPSRPANDATTPRRNPVATLPSGRAVSNAQIREATRAAEPFSLRPGAMPTEPSVVTAPVVSVGEVQVRDSQPPPSPVSGRRRLVSPVSVPPIAPLAGAPTSARCTTPVPYIVLVALDLSEPGGRAWRFAFDLAQLRGETEIHAVVVGTRGLAPRVRDLGVSLVSKSVGEKAPMPPLKVLQHQSAGGQARLMAMHYRTGRPDKAIVRLAEEISADLIVVAKQEATRLERLFGLATADRIARTAPCPVVVVKPKNERDEHAFAEFEPRRAAG